MGSVQYMAPEQMMGERVAVGPTSSRWRRYLRAAHRGALLAGRHRGRVPGRAAPRSPGEVDPRFPEPVNEAFARALRSSASRTGKAMDFARGCTRRRGARPGRSCAPFGAFPPIRRGHRAGARIPSGHGPAPTRGLLFLDSDPPGARCAWTGRPSARRRCRHARASLARHVVRMEADGREAVSADVELKRPAPRALKAHAACPRTLPCARAAWTSPPTLRAARCRAACSASCPAGGARRSGGCARRRVWIGRPAVMTWRSPNRRGVARRRGPRSRRAGSSPATLRGVLFRCA